MPTKPKKPPGSGKHSVKDGEWTGSICARYGYADWESIWDDEHNAALREKRGDPHVLGEGDELWVPQWEKKQAERGTGSKHRFVLHRGSDTLRVRLMTSGTPRADVNYTLKVTHDDGDGAYKQQGEKTDDQGCLSEKIPLTTTKAELKLKGSDDTIELRVGALCPLDLDKKKLLIKGTQQRLTALGYKPGPIDGEDGPKTQAAVRAFQAFCADHAGENESIVDAGPVDGVVGPKTKKALEAAYGC